MLENLTPYMNINYFRYIHMQTSMNVRHQITHA